MADVSFRAIPPIALAVLCGSLLLAAPEGEYEIGPSDILKIVVLGQPEMSGDFTVEPDGILNFPLLAKVKVSEMTPAEVEKKLTAMLADGFFRKPHVSVLVKEYRSQRVFVTGAVQRPGPYALKSDRSLFGLLADMGNLGADVGREVIVTRAPHKPAPPRLAEMAPEGTVDRGDRPPEPVPTPEVIRVSLQDLESARGGKNLILRAGDTITIPQAPQVYVSGHVARPGPYRYQEGMTILQVINLAGGVTERGSSGRLKAVRIVEGKKTEAKVELTDQVQPEDMIVVSERFF
jgi:polysaccharide export outer membrane protein